MFPSHQYLMDGHYQTPHTTAHTHGPVDLILSGPGPGPGPGGGVKNYKFMKKHIKNNLVSNSGKTIPGI